MKSVAIFDKPKPYRATVIVDAKSYDTTSTVSHENEFLLFYNKHTTAKPVKSVRVSKK